VVRGGANFDSICPIPPEFREPATTVVIVRCVESNPSAAATPGGDVGELTVVTLIFDASDESKLLDVLARYVVVARSHPGCRNIDLCASVTVPSRYVVIEKWASAAAQRAHFDSPDMVAMAEACKGLLTAPPAIDLLTGVSAHDLA
jgi:quinol monooxygenase YgiN